jgi:DNA-directed RNA polymerase subunit H (RpoH/RPB5)
MHRVNQYEFDVTDQEQWNLLKSGLNREDLPKIAPEDP